MSEPDGPTEPVPAVTAAPDAAPAVSPSARSQPTVELPVDATTPAESPTEALPVATDAGDAPTATLPTPTDRPADAPTEPVAATTATAELPTEVPPSTTGATADAATEVTPSTTSATAETPADDIPKLTPLSEIPERRGKALLVAMCVLTVLLLAATGVMTYAFLNRNHAYHHQTRVVAQRNTTINTITAQNNTLKSQLSAAQAQISQLQQQASDATNQLNDLTQAKAALSKCINSVNAFFTAAGSNPSGAANPTAVNQAASKMEADCAAAAKYLG
jgi:hypothetical protein